MYGSLHRGKVRLRERTKPLIVHFGNAAKTGEISPYFAAGFWFQPGDEANRVIKIRLSE
jgi:hypothetical protein